MESLVNPDNSYSRQRLSSYGLKTAGWDLLPVWNPRSIRLPVDKEQGKIAPLWDGAAPADWATLGREVFFGYPLRAEPLVELAITDPKLAESVGLEKDGAGAYVGLVQFVDVDGRSRVGISCALCHAAVVDGAIVPGVARRHLDYGKLKLAFHARTGAPLDAELAQRMATWGAGRADVTEDKDEDPVAIPDLFGLAEQSFFTQAGTIRNTGPVALAIRQETQLLHSNHEKVRPPRELAWALAMYLLSLTPPPQQVAVTAETERGSKLFARGCSECHSNAAGGGAPVDAARVGTDLAFANGAARGTGKYRPPALLRVRDNGPYLHHGAISTLDELLSPARLSASYSGSPLGPGPVPGHEWGTDWPAEDRAAVVAYLETL